MNKTRMIIRFAVAFVLVWAAGLMIFVNQVEALSTPVISPSMEKTDGIVVLTGGSERLPAGLALLRAGIAGKLFISGVHPGLSLDNVIGLQPIEKNLRECCIILGHMAESTLGNADETNTWMVAEDFHSMYLVTANYHMLRSLMLFHAAMPDIKIIPFPITPDNFHLENWWQHTYTMSLLATEYNKYVWAIMRQWVEGHI